MDLLLLIAREGLPWLAVALAHVWGMLGGVAMCLFAIHLVRVQPKPDPSDVGMSDRDRAALLAIPIFIAGLVLVVWLAGKDA